MKIRYKNYRGEIAIRNIRPICMWHGSTPYHPGVQWFINAEDLDRPGTIRDFAMADIGSADDFEMIDKLATANLELALRINHLEFQLTEAKGFLAWMTQEGDRRPSPSKIMERAIWLLSRLVLKPTPNKFEIGQQVVKASGYRFPGVVRSVFTNQAGDTRYVVEATGEDYLGMLHIYNESQLNALD